MSTPSGSRPGRTCVAALAIGLAMLGASAALMYYRAARPGREGPGHWRAVAAGQAALARGRPDLALEAVAHIRDEADGAGEAMTIAGLALLQLNEIKGARLALERALKLRPNQLGAARALAEVSLRLGNGERAAELLRTVTRLDPRDARAWLVAGRVRHDLGDPAGAADALEQALRLRPHDRDARLDLIRELSRIHEPDRATRWLSEALRDQPEDARVLGLAAVQAREVGRADEAAALAERALARDPDNLEALLVRARTSLLGGRDDRALIDSERAVAVRPSDLRALQLLAQVESRLGLTERAARTIERQRKARERALLMDRLVQEIARRPDDPGPRFQLGQAAAQQGATLLAARCLQASLALDPNFRPAKEALAGLAGLPQGTPPPAPHRPSRVPTEAAGVGSPSAAVRPDGARASEGRPAPIRW